MSTNDPFELGRFLDAQEERFDDALAELRAGRKRTRWMWFVFPQYSGLGSSPASVHYAVRSLAEASAYLAHPVLGPRLEACTYAVLDHPDRSLEAIFGPVDALKFQSSMTLFELVAGMASPWARALDCCCAGARDTRTLALVRGG